MDKPNIFKEDTDLNICKSWLVGSTDGQTYSITERFIPRIKEDKTERDFYDKVNAHIDGEIIPACPYLSVDDPGLEEMALKLVNQLEEYIRLTNERTAEKEKAQAERKIEPKGYLAVITESGKEKMSCKFDRKYDATLMVIQLLYVMLGDGDGENGGKGSLYNCADEIFTILFNGTGYCYADCTFAVRPIW